MFVTIMPPFYCACYFRGSIDFKELVKSLDERFSPSNQTELYRTQLRERRQRAVETLPEFGQDVRRFIESLQLNCMPNGIAEIDGSCLFYSQSHVSINQ
jgi:hypothetical protein